MAQVPETFKAARIIEYGKPLQVETVHTPELQNGEFLIKVEAAPINPSDAIFIRGGYGNLPLPGTPGWEGSGVIVKLGPGTPDFLKVGDRVATYATLTKGTYAEYAVGHIDKFLKLDDETTFEQGAAFYINPITVLGIIHVVKKSGQNAFIHNAAASALGRQLSRYAQLNNIHLINIVRRQEQVDLLRSEGAQIVLNESDPKFNEELKTISEQLKVQILFDPVSGEKTGQLLQLLPKGTTAYVYGYLSGNANIITNFFDLALNKKSVKGYTLTEYHEDHPNLFQDIEFHKRLNQLIRGELKTQFQKEFSLEQINEALEFSQAQATAGKVLIRPHQK